MDNQTANKNKAIFITGASTGIGKATALQLDRIGFKVFATVLKPGDDKELLSEGSERINTMVMDVKDDDSIAAAVKLVSEGLGECQLTGLVNNAGTVALGPLECIPMSDLLNMFEINVKGTLMVTRALLPLLRQGKGRIINISSISAQVTIPYGGAYSATKAGMESLGDALRLELLRWGIKVVSVQPGVVATPLWNRPFSIVPDEASKLYGKDIDAQREELKKGMKGIPPEKVANVVARSLTAKRPKRRYRVGPDAKILGFLFSVLPASARDRLIMMR